MNLLVCPVELRDVSVKDDGRKSASSRLAKSLQRCEESSQLRLYSISSHVDSESQFSRKWGLTFLFQKTTDTLHSSRAVKPVRSLLRLRNTVQLASLFIRQAADVRDILL